MTIQDLINRLEAIPAKDRGHDVYVGNDWSIAKAYKVEVDEDGDLVLEGDL